MPVVDMPLNELLEYQGSSPAAADIDKYWDNALKQLDTIKSNVRLEKADFQNPVADCYDMFFTGTGGAEIHSKLLVPKNLDKPAPAVIRFHGYRCKSEAWTDLLCYAASGVVAASMDCRGQGEFSQDNLCTNSNTVLGLIIKGMTDGKDNLYYKNVFLDCVQIARIIMDMDNVNASKVASIGGSQGGALALVCAALEPKINRTAPQYPYLSDYKRAWNLDLTGDAYQQLRQYFRWFDPLHENEDKIFETLSYIDIQNIAKRIKGKVLFFASMRDVVCPPSTQFAVYNKINSEKQLKIYHDFGHERLVGAEDLTYQFIIEMQN